MKEWVSKTTFVLFALALPMLKAKTNGCVAESRECDVAGLPWVMFSTY